jgi:hypothetical protein
VARYIRAVRHLLVLALFVACGSHPDVKHTTPGGGTTHATRQGSAAGSGSAAPTPVAVPEVGCLAPSCAYHAGAAAYFTCLAGGAGACFHFGAPCTPADSCMFDAADKTYKQCMKPVEGQCQQWGAACAPASACMFNPADGLHHHCEQITGGTCAKLGALCSP